jgi:hypothetical protein
MDDMDMQQLIDERNEKRMQEELDVLLRKFEQEAM